MSRHREREVAITLRRRWAYLVALLSAIALVTAACGSSGGQGEASGTSGAGSESTVGPWVHGIVTAKGDGGFVLMAQHQGYYKQEGVNVDVKQFTGNVQLIRALISGSVDSIETAPGVVYKAVAKGADLKIIGSTLPGLYYYLYSKSSIKTLADLKGKTVGVSSPGSLPDTFTRAVMDAKGVDPDSIKTVSAGGSAQRFQALVAGRVDAIAGSPEFSKEIKPGDNVHVLAKATDVVPKFPHFVIVANEKALKQKPKAAQRFLAAEMRGISYAMHNKNAEISVAAKAMRVSTDDPTLAFDYQTVMDTKAASPTCEIPTAKLEWLQNFLVKSGIQKKKIDLNTLTDGSYRQQALKLVAGKIPEVPSK